MNTELLRQETYIKSFFTTQNRLRGFISFAENIFNLLFLKTLEEKKKSKAKNRSKTLNEFHHFYDITLNTITFKTLAH